MHGGHRRTARASIGAMLTMGLLAAGCGGSESDQDDVRAAADAFIIGVSQADGEAACGALTEAGQARLTQLVNRSLASRPGREPAEDCLGLFTGFGPEDVEGLSADQIRKRIDEADLFDSIELDGDSGTIQLRDFEQLPERVTPADLAVPVVETDGEWLVDDPSALMLMLGTGTETIGGEAREVPAQP